MHSQVLRWLIKERREENHKDRKSTKAWMCYLSLCQPVKKKSKRWITDSFCTAESVIHLFDFFFYSSGYGQAGYYCQAFVLFVSLWFSLCGFFLFQIS
jgi:hypothetical protein